jgi:hypothetical protein
MTKQEAIRRLYELIADINAEEVADHIRDGVSLQDWTNVWRCAAKDALRVLEDTSDTPARKDFYLFNGCRKCDAKGHCIDAFTETAVHCSAYVDTPQTEREGE